MLTWMPASKLTMLAVQQRGLINPPLYPFTWLDLGIMQLQGQILFPFSPLDVLKRSRRHFDCLLVAQYVAINKFNQES